MQIKWKKENWLSEQKVGLMEFFHRMMERFYATWRNRRFFQFRKFHYTEAPVGLTSFNCLFIYVTSWNSIRISLAVKLGGKKYATI